MNKTICCTCGKIFITKIKAKTTTYDFCSDKCWFNAPASLPNKTQ